MFLPLLLMHILMGFQIFSSQALLRSLGHQRASKRYPFLFRQFSVGKDSESHLLPRLYVGPMPEAALPLLEYLSSYQSNTNAIALKEGSIQQLTSEQAHYVTNVMRLFQKKGRWTFQGVESCVRIFDGNKEWVAQLESMDDLSKKSRRKSQDITIFAKCLALVREAPQPAATVMNPILCFAPPKKKDRFQWMVEKSTELGMGAWMLLGTDRTEASSSRDYHGKGQAYVLEAAEQCERLTVPPLLSATTEEESTTCSLDFLMKVLSEWKEDADYSILVCRERGNTSVPILDALEQIKAQHNSNPQNCLVLIGPEGGWSPSEETAFDKLSKETDSKLINVSLGSNVLRTDTAAVAAMASFSFQEN